MNPSLIRHILLVKAVESQPEENRLLCAEQQQAATQNALYALRASEAASHQSLAAKQRYVLQLLSRRADLQIAALGQAEPKRKAWLAALTAAPSLWLLWAAVALAFAVGFGLDRIADPHQINLLSLPLLGILLWNGAIYLLLLVRPLLALMRKDTSTTAPAWGLKVNAVWQRIKRQARFKKNSPEAAVAQQFWADWLALSRPLWLARFALGLQLSAAALALGLLASLWFTGLATEYRVGWESTLLNAEQVQALLNGLTWPAHWVLGTPLWSLEEVQWLRTWPAGTQQEGLRWLQIYTVLVVGLVVLPRLWLAMWALVQWQIRAKRLRLPLTDAYFRGLIKDFNSDLTHLVIQPYSLQVSEARAHSIEAFAHAQYGQAAHCHVLASQSYGASASAFEWPTGKAPVEADNATYVLLFNLAATPEKEAHGAALVQWRTRYEAHAEVWVYCVDYAQRLAAQTDGALRVAERKRLWAQFIQAEGFTALFMEAP